MSKYDTEEFAIANLIEGKKPDCIEALEKLFWQARGSGLSIREASVYAGVVHFITDHDGLNDPRRSETRFPGDAEALAVLQEAHDTALREHPEEADDSNRLAQEVRKWYDLVRSWGADPDFAFVIATQAAEEIYEEENDMDEQEALEFLETFPVEEYKSVVLEAFKAARAKGNTVYASLEASKEAGQLAALADLMGDLGGGSDLLQ